MTDTSKDKKINYPTTFSLTFSLDGNLPQSRVLQNKYFGLHFASSSTSVTPLLLADCVRVPGGKDENRNSLWNKKCKNALVRTHSLQSAMKVKRTFR